METANNYTMAVGYQVRKYRSHQALSQSELADKACLPIDAVTKLEAGIGGVNGAVIYQIASALGISLKALFGVASQRDKMRVAARPGADKSAMDKMRNAALGYFADLELVKA
ncbi:helix-turn-helix domain-containing protein [Schaalia turicensis]|uniref:helix-turn-helix domain-containing protein n=1 Tax=Schaalia turicensis TaxID=131111 RepID=UPI0036CE3321